MSRLNKFENLSLATLSSRVSYLWIKPGQDKRSSLFGVIGSDEEKVLKDCHQGVEFPLVEVGLELGTGPELVQIKQHQIGVESGLSIYNVLSLFTSVLVAIVQ